MISLHESASVTTYLAFWITGGALWLVVSLYLAARDGLPILRSSLVFISVVIFFTIGARLHSLLLELHVPLSHLLSSPTLLLQPGYRLPGGILFALITVPLIAAVCRVPALRLLDTAAPAAGLALGVGRLGCFLRGCCHGRISELPWGVSHPAGTDVAVNHISRGLIEAGQPSLPVVPFPLLLSVAALAVFVTALRFRRRYVGELTLVTLAGLGLSLGLLDGLRENVHAATVPYRQSLQLTLGVGAAVVVVFLRQRHAAPAKTARNWSRNHREHRSSLTLLERR